MRVKQLEWTQDRDGDWNAKSPLGSRYSVWRIGANGLWETYAPLGSMPIKRSENPEECKTAAQRHFERLVILCLE